MHSTSIEDDYFKDSESPLNLRSFRLASIFLPDQTSLIDQSLAAQLRRGDHLASTLNEIAENENYRFLSRTISLGGMKLLSESRY